MKGLAADPGGGMKRQKETPDPMNPPKPVKPAQARFTGGTGPRPARVPLNEGGD